MKQVMVMSALLERHDTRSCAAREHSLAEAGFELADRPGRRYAPPDRFGFRSRSVTGYPEMEPEPLRLLALCRKRNK
jgi:hypothetical protein